MRPFAALALLIVLSLTASTRSVDAYSGPVTALRDACAVRIAEIDGIAEPTKSEKKEQQRLTKVMDKLDSAFALLDLDAGGEDPRSEGKGISGLAQALKLLGKAGSPDPDLGPAAMEVVRTQCESHVTKWKEATDGILARLEGKQHAKISKLAAKGEAKVVAARGRWATDPAKGASAYAKANRAVRKAVVKGEKLTPEPPPGKTFTGNYVIGSTEQLNEFLEYTEITGNLTIWGYLVAQVDLSNLRTVGGELRISSVSINGSIIESARFPSLESVGGFLRLENVQLTEFDAPVLGSVYGLVIENCDQLTDLDGLDGLETASWSVVLKWNDALADISGLGGIAGEQFGLNITGNPALASLAGLGGITTLTGGATISDNDALKTLNGLNLRSVEGSVFIDGNDGLTDLTGLETLHTVKGTLSIEDCRSLIDLRGLSGVTQLAHLTILRNPNLETLTGLKCPSTLTGNVIFEFLPKLESIQALRPLQSLGQTLRFYVCNVLADLSPLSNLVSLGDDLKLEALPELKTLAGLENLRTIDSELVIRQCTSLDDVSALWNLQRSSKSGKVAVIFKWQENIGTFLAHQLVDKCGGESAFGTLEITP